MICAQKGMIQEPPNSYLTQQMFDRITLGVVVKKEVEENGQTDGVHTLRAHRSSGALQ
jgi:hypothetical protein